MTDAREPSEGGPPQGSQGWGVGVLTGQKKRKKILC